MDNEKEKHWIVRCDAITGIMVNYKSLYAAAMDIAEKRGVQHDSVFKALKKAVKNGSMSYDAYWYRKVKPIETVNDKEK